VSIDKGIACIKVDKREIEGSVAAFPVDIRMRQHPKEWLSRHFTTAVFNIINCVWINKKAVLIKRKHICNKQLSRSIRFVPLYRSQRTVIFWDGDKTKQRSVCQRCRSVSIKLEWTDSRLRNISQKKHQTSYASKEVLPAKWIIPMLLPDAGEHLARIRTNKLNNLIHHKCSRRSLARWVGGIELK